MDYESKHVLSCFIVGKNGHPLSSIIKNMVNPNMMAFTIHPDFFRGLTMTYHDTFLDTWQCVKTNSTHVVHIKIAGLKW